MQYQEELSIRENLKASLAYDHIKKIVNMTREYVNKSGRLAGTPADTQAIDYIRREFENAGLKIQMDELTNFDSWSEEQSSTEILSPLPQVMTCCAVPGSGSTSDKGIEGEVVYIGRGITEETKSKDIAGKIVFHDPPEVRRVDNPMSYSVLGKPIEMGAIGIIEYSEITGHIIQPRALGQYAVSVPVTCITYEDALRLKELLNQWYAVPTGFLVEDKIPVRARLKVKAKVAKGITHNVIGTIKGDKYPDEKIVLVAHHDGVHTSPSANDNGSSLSILIELSKIFSKLRKPSRTIVFLAVAGEEIGYIGAKDFVNRYKKEIKACVTMDIIGAGDKQLIVTRNAYEDHVVKSAPWLDEKIATIAQELGYYLEEGPVDYSADNGPFEDAGIPTSYLGASMRLCWPFLHTYLDDIDAIDPNRLKTIGDIVGVALWRLANADKVKDA